jgi:hypothetical protein
MAIIKPSEFKPRLSTRSSLMASILAEVRLPVLYTDTFTVVHGVLVFCCEAVEGLLYFDDMASFTGLTTLKYTVSKLTHSDTTYAHIRFYQVSSDDCYLEVCCMPFSSTHSLMLFYFISSSVKIPCVLRRLSASVLENKSQASAVTGAGMNHYSSQGIWDEFKMNTASASVKKDKDKRTITVVIDQSPIKATITDKNNVLKGTKFGAYFHALNIFTRTNIQAKDVEGTIYYKAIEDIKDGIYANYNNDRIVFYSNDYSGKDFTAYVCPPSYLSLFEL